MTQAVVVAQGGSNNVTMRNRIINGAMMVNQRNSTVTSTASGAYITDRWNTYADQSYSIAQDTDAPTGYSNSLKVTKTSTSQSSYAFLVQYIEGLNCVDLAFGTASASTVTISFWVKSSITGNFAVSLTNSAENRTYAALYAINAANTWEQKSVTIQGDTSGTWLKTNGKGISLQFNYGQAAGAGSVNTWVATTNIAPAGCTNLGTTNNATFYITGVQLEAGTTATPFEQRLYGTELALCQRYCVVYGGNNIYESVGYGFSPNSTSINTITAVPVPMRTVPSVSASGSFQISDGATGFVIYVLSISTNLSGNQQIALTATSTGLTAQRGYRIESANNTSARITFSAEL